MSYASEVLADSPVWYLKLDEPSGTTAIDSSTSALNGTYVNSPTLGLTVGPLSSGGTAATFASASSQTVTRADNAALHYADTFTIEAWIQRPNLAAIHLILEKGSTQGELRITASNTLSLVKTGVAVIVTSTSAIGNNTWTHVACTKSGATSNLYINGVDKTGTVTDATCVSTVNALSVASTGSANYLDGSLAHVALYTTALSAARIAAHYAAAFATGSDVMLPMGMLGTGRV